MRTINKLYLCTFFLAMLTACTSNPYLDRMEHIKSIGEENKSNAQTYIEQAFKVLDKEKTEVLKNDKDVLVKFYSPSCKLIKFIILILFFYF